ncbi:bifunctional 2',3'-cyclic-nucleotide 2'-phosphodiesterase/3'-nucleotidase [Cypionkella sp.]|uniref:bifunctional 2',3'-cyclic-nucleotide 2'-phosphodiesterase/3'-nucleotidase n=1 Tax=Cypionkella sp. TaxID=2811411 RepID=UPI002AB8FBFC|nr:bifunctional 2',3'-cyclic-nucleotide 2'-phosphodiesterase/3'-nucleotidase [Cypionkella sp.]MDZ4393567.1 bifunctional 2',3'-cyclic-nucleotide 2'-phosphodiesterase/3'-nucleotidase [Cypionkella sp.]
MQYSYPNNRGAISGAFGGAEIDLRILATSDLHANLLAWDYHANRACPQRGLARVATLIHKARFERPQALLFDNGDFLHGTVLGDFIAETTPTLRSGRPLHAHPMIAAMNALDYDAVALGNHEFGHGLGFLRRSLAATRFPVVCSNLYFKPTRGAPLAAPYLLLHRDLRDRHGKSHRLKIGVLGFIPPQTTIWEKRYLKSRASVDDIAASARLLVPELRALGADLIIALSHSGIGDAESEPGAENASSALAAIDGIDVVIAGHTHLTFPTAMQPNLVGKPAVMPGFFGSHLGVIDLTLRQSGKNWRITMFGAEARPISQRDPITGEVQALVGDDSAIAEIARPAHEALLARTDVEIGDSPITLHSHFALLTPTPALSLVASAQADQMARLLAAGRHASLPLLSAVAPFKAGGRGGPENYTDIPAGPLRARHISDLYIHPNSLSCLRVSGQDLADWLERAVSLYHQITPGAVDAALIDQDFPSFNFDVIPGLSYQIDLAEPPRFNTLGRVIAPEAQRIRDLRHQGQVVRPEQMFALATNSYRAAGGVGFPGTGTAQVIYEGTENIREVLASFLRNGAVPAPTSPDWGFVPMPGSTVTLDLNPNAAAHLDEVPHLRLEPLMQLASGFRRFRLYL